MDLYATMFGLGMLLLSLMVAYHWGIKPEREKKRRAERASAEMRQQTRRRQPQSEPPNRQTVTSSRRIV
ncbi:MAG TPA: hypothetical protein VMZ30_01035 [Pyrinomonadaceae bacterium]|nr:hypothetical protein [Pyrinomonadaceae bacterium]